MIRRNAIAALLLAAGLALAGSAVWSPHGPSTASPVLKRLPDTSLGGTLLYRKHQPAVRVQPAGSKDVIAVLTIPKLGISGAPVYERGLDPTGSMLIAHGYAVTHYAYSAPIGGGNAVLYGHDDIEGSIFGRLKDLAPGDEIDVRIGAALQVYRVSSRAIVPPTAVQILDPTPDVRLTVFTCWPNWVDTHRVVITATPATAF